MNVFPSIERLRFKSLSEQKYILVRPEELNTLLDVVEAAREYAGHEPVVLTEDYYALIEALDRFTREES